MDEKKVFENRAGLSSEDSSITDNSCEHCDEPLLFAMQDNYHQFSMGLFTVLNCLKLAEADGAVPKLPPDWWISLANRYQQNFHKLE